MKKIASILLLIFFYKLSFCQILYDNGGLGGSSSFTTNGSWNTPNLTYSFQNGTPDIIGDDERNSIIQAFQLWADYTNLTFTQVSSNGDINILWGSSNHGDGFPFDGVNATLAHAFYPPPTGGGILSGDIHFDEDETWSTALQPSPATQPIDLVTVAAHEIGHALGLGHSSVYCALMNPVYNGSHRFLSQDDIDGIRSLYVNRNVIRNNGFTCAGGVFFINNLPPNTSVFWTSSNTSIATVQNNIFTNEGTVSWTGTNSGPVTLIATISLPCGSSVIELVNLNIGSSSAINGISTEYSQIHCTINGYKHTISGAENATNFKWYYRNITQGTTFILYKNSPLRQQRSPIDGGSCDQIEILIEATNPCNPTTPQTFTFLSDMCPPFTDGSCTSGRTVSANPNPATSNIQITLIDDPTVIPVNSHPRKIKKIRIIDKLGQTKKNFVGNNLESMTINISELPLDIYTVLVYDGNAWMGKQISKN